MIIATILFLIYPFFKPKPSQMLHIRTQFRSLLVFALFLLPSLGAYASHIVGADLTYSWVSGNTYKITLSVYADCGPASAGAYATLDDLTAHPQICIYDGATPLAGMPFLLDTASPLSGIEVTPPLCPGDISQCINTSSTIPGITLFTYSGNYTLPYASASWRFVFNSHYGPSSAGRAAAITNIGGGTGMSLEARLNNSTGNNTNPVLHIIPLPYYAINLPQTYNPVAVDGDGDSLVYSLVPASCYSGGAGTCIASVPPTYVGTAWGTTPVSATTPFRVAAGTFSFSSVTGTISFVPNYLQRSIAVYEIKEYRAGVLVGSLQREITILVNSSANNLPGGEFASPVACTLVDSVTISVCDTIGAFSVQIPGLDADALDTIVVTSLGIPSGASFTTTGNGTPTPVSTFSWNTSFATPGLHNFYVTYTDDACPMSGAQTICFAVNVIDCTPVTPPPPPPTSVTDKAQLAGGIKVFPNPSNGTFTITATHPFDNATITITDAIGRIVKQEKANDNSKSMSFNLGNIAEGTYSVRVVSNKGTYFEKIVINK